MAARTQLDKQIKSVLKYDVSRPYFGEFTFSDLYNAQRYLRRREYYRETGSREMSIYIGKINGDVICGALWRLMGYNPGRFTVNPFLYNGKNDIFRFVTNTIPYSTNIDTNAIIVQLHSKLREYLTANANPNGQWQDEIQTTNGFVSTVLNDGRAGATYKKLCLLRDAIRTITKQNCTDFDARRGPYRNKIIQMVQLRHPEIFGNNNTNMVNATKVDESAHVTRTVRAPTEIELAEEKIYEKMEHVQITLDNRGCVSNELYEQACAEMAALTEQLYAIRNNYTL